MPHVIVKVATGKTSQQKTDLTARITAAVKEVLAVPDEAVSVAIEEIDPKEWADKVYTPDILMKPTTIYKKPGYNPFER